MASGSFKVSTSNQYVVGEVSWTSTKDEANNRSTVKAELRMWRNNTGYTTYGPGDFYITIDGTRFEANNKDFTLTYNSNTLLLSGSKVVNHNADGSKSITIAWGGNTAVFNINDASGTARLDEISRGRANIKVGSTWRNGQVYVKVSGSWRQAVGVFAKVSGTWRRSI